MLALDGPRDVVEQLLAEVAVAQLRLRQQWGTSLEVVDAGEDAFGAAARAASGRGDEDVVVTLDANGRHDPSQLPALLERLVTADLDVVIGSRWTRGSTTPGLTLQRWLLGRMANLAFRLLTGTRGIADATTSFRVARASVFSRVDAAALPARSHALQTAFVALAVAAGARVGEAPVRYRPPLVPGGEMRAADVLAFAAHLLRLRSRVDTVRQRRLSAAGRSFRDGHFGAADDLERLSSADAFFSWVLDEFVPHLRGRVLEVGAGTGTITRRLIRCERVTSVVALEPARNLFTELAAYAQLTPDVAAHPQTLAEHLPSAGGSFDAVVYLNVLEHVADDADELRLAASALRPGGALLVFVPALEALYSELDHKAGHYRRYDLPRLRELVTAAGLDVVSLRYFDLLGVAPYFLVYRLLRSTRISGSTLWGYDRVVVPVSRAVQRLVPHPPLGKNVVLVARRPSG